MVQIQATMHGLDTMIKQVKEHLYGVMVQQLITLIGSQVNQTTVVQQKVKIALIFGVVVRGMI